MVIDKKTIDASGNFLKKNTFYYHWHIDLTMGDKFVATKVVIVSELLITMVYWSW